MSQSNDSSNTHPNNEIDEALAWLEDVNSNSGSITTATEAGEQLSSGDTPLPTWLRKDIRLAPTSSTSDTSSAVVDGVGQISPSAEANDKDKLSWFDNIVSELGAPVEDTPTMSWDETGHFDLPKETLQAKALPAEARSPIQPEAEPEANVDPVAKVSIEEPDDLPSLLEKPSLNLESFDTPIMKHDAPTVVSPKPLYDQDASGEGPNKRTNGHTQPASGSSSVDDELDRLIDQLASTGNVDISEDATVVAFEAGHPLDLPELKDYSEEPTTVAQQHVEGYFEEPTTVELPPTDDYSEEPTTIAQQMGPVKWADGDLEEGTIFEDDDDHITLSEEHFSAAEASSILEALLKDRAVSPLDTSASKDLIDEVVPGKFDTAPSNSGDTNSRKPAIVSDDVLPVPLPEAERLDYVDTSPVVDSEPVSDVPVQKAQAEPELPVAKAEEVVSAESPQQPIDRSEEPTTVVLPPSATHPVSKEVVDITADVPEDPDEVVAWLERMAKVQANRPIEVLAEPIEEVDDEVPANLITQIDRSEHATVIAPPDVYAASKEMEAFMRELERELEYGSREMYVDTGPVVDDTGPVADAEPESLADVVAGIPTDLPPVPVEPVVDTAAAVVDTAPSVKDVSSDTGPVEDTGPVADLTLPKLKDVETPTRIEQVSADIPEDLHDALAWLEHLVDGTDSSIDEMTVELDQMDVQALLDEERYNHLQKLMDEAAKVEPGAVDPASDTQAVESEERKTIIAKTPESVEFYDEDEEAEGTVTLDGKSAELEEALEWLENFNDDSRDDESPIEKTLDTSSLKTFPMKGVFHDERMRARDALAVNDFSTVAREYTLLIQQEGALEVVRSDMERLIEEMPTQPIFYRVLGDVYIQQGDFQTAASTYRRGLDHL